MKTFPFLLLGIYLLSSSCSYKNKLTAKNLVLSPVYSSGMILQSTPKTRLSGYASPGGVLAVKIKDYIRLAKAGENGKWEVQFPSINYTKPFSITIEAADTLIQLKNIQAGKVFAIAGNIGMDPLKAQEFSNCSQPGTGAKIQIRVFQAEESVRGGLQGKWYPVDELPETAQNCAVVQAIRNNLNEETGLIGIINLTRPGAQLQTWLEPSSRLYDPHDSLSYQDRIKEPFLLSHKSLLDSVIFLKDSSRNALDNRVTRIWYNDDSWRNLRLPANIAERTSSENKKLVYLRKTIQIAPRYVNSDFTIDMGYCRGESEYYFNEVSIPSRILSGRTRILIPDTLIKTYNNLLCIRLFLTDSLSGFYGNDFVCYNEDSSYYESIQNEWKYNDALEKDFPEYLSLFNTPTVLYRELLSKLQDIPVEGLYWYDSYLEEPENLRSKLSEILHTSHPGVKKYLLYPSVSGIDSLLFPAIIDMQLETLKQVADSSGALLIPFSR